MTGGSRNVGTSVRDRLLRIAREQGEDFQLLLIRYANERLLHRVAESPFGRKFVLKSATLFTIWTGRPHRATRDLDLLGFGDPGEDHVRSVFADVLATDAIDDGLVFDLDSLTAGPIRKGSRKNKFVGPRALMRPPSKARGGRNLTGFNRRATRLGGMQLPSNPEVILARALRTRSTAAFDSRLLLT